MKGLTRDQYKLLHSMVKELGLADRQKVFNAAEKYGVEAARDYAQHLTRISRKENVR